MNNTPNAPNIPLFRTHSPAPPLPPAAQAQVIRRPNDRIHLHTISNSYEDCWSRINHSLQRHRISAQAFVHLVQVDTKTLACYEHLSKLGRSVSTAQGVTLLPSNMGDEMWWEVHHCRSRGDQKLLGKFLLNEQSRLSVNTNVTPQRQGPVGLALARSAPGQFTHAQHLSPGSPSSWRSRSPSNATTRSSETGDCDKDLWCPLKALDNCKHPVFKKWGNLRNHVEREHKWYVRTNPAWKDELFGHETLESDQNHSHPPIMQPSTPRAVDFEQVGTGFQMPSNVTAARSVNENFSGQDPFYVYRGQSKPQPSPSTYSIQQDSPMSPSQQDIQLSPALDVQQDLEIDDMMFPETTQDTNQFTSQSPQTRRMPPGSNLLFNEFNAPNSAQASRANLTNGW
jgi:hypothetical protein